MKRTYRSWLVCGMAASTAVWAATILARRARARRQALARQVNEVTRHAVGRLGVRAQSQFLHVNEVGLHSVVAGPPAGPLVVLLHGFPECWYSWQHQIPALARAGYRVVVPDQRGYNLSDKPAGAHNYQIDQLTGDVRDLIQAMGRERATLVGHDWGGVVAWRFAMDYPDMVDKLVRIFTSLRLTVVLLALGLVLVFWGTLAQVHLGLYRAQNEFFRSFFIYWSPSWSTNSTRRRELFPPGAVCLSGNRTPSRWREFCYLCHELARAIVPAIPLTAILENWSRMAQALTEPSRKRRPQLEAHGLQTS